MICISVKPGQAVVVGGELTVRLKVRVQGGVVVTVERFGSPPGGGAAQTVAYGGVVTLGGEFGRVFVDEAPRNRHGNRSTLTRLRFDAPRHVKVIREDLLEKHAAAMAPALQLGGGRGKAGAL